MSFLTQLLLPLVPEALEIQRKGLELLGSSWGAPKDVDIEVPTDVPDDLLILLGYSSDEDLTEFEELDSYVSTVQFTHNDELVKGVWLRLPEEFQDDFDVLLSRRRGTLSSKYVDAIVAAYPGQEEEVRAQLAEEYPSKAV